MSDVLIHHGILGMKWGVRRTPAQLGHDTGAKTEGPNRKGTSSETEKKTPGKSEKRSRAMSDDELRQRINRLNMEEQYKNLVARQKERNDSTLKKMCVNALKSFGQKGFDFAVNWAAKKVFSEKDPDSALKREIEALSLQEKRADLLSKKIARENPIDIKQWRDADVRTMDYDTALKISKWYSLAQNIAKGREVVNGSS